MKNVNFFVFLLVICGATTVEALKCYERTFESSGEESTPKLPGKPTSCFGRHGPVGPHGPDGHPSDPPGPNWDPHGSAGDLPDPSDPVWDDRSDGRNRPRFIRESPVDYPDENRISCVTIVSKGTYNLSGLVYISKVEKKCGNCDAYPDAYDAECTSCNTDYCNGDWPTNLKCYSGIQMEGHDYNSFNEANCSLSTVNCTREEFHVDGVKFVQKMCANKCQQCNTVIKNVNATVKEKEGCSHYVGCSQCSGNLCNGVGGPTLNVPFTLAVMAFAILFGVRNGDNMIGFLY